MARFALFLAGLTASVGQIVLIREVIALFNGNELSLGFVLAAGLLWTAIGSSFAGWLFRKASNLRGILAVEEILCGVSLPLSICALREARALSQTVPGEVLGPVRATVLCLVCLSIFCALSGSLFSLAAQMMRQESAVSPTKASSSAYLLETTGAAVGGIVTSVLLLRIFSCMQIAVLVAFLCVVTGTCLTIRRLRIQIAVLVIALFIAIPLIIHVAPRLDMLTQQRLWPQFELLDSEDSPYGRLTVIGANGMRSIYDNGSILANVPDPAAAEDSVHYALLQHFAPRRVLLIGNGINGSISEILKHPTLERIDYAELDPMLIAIYRRLFPREAAQSFSDPRVHVHEMDGRLYLQSATNKFDVIVVNLPDPANAQLNRFYTTEFFHIVREHIASGGLLALQLHSSAESFSPELAVFLRCIDRTLRTVFPRVIVIPNESLHFFASGDSAGLTDDPQVLVTRFRDRDLQTLYVREYFIPFHMTPDRMSQVHELLNMKAGTPINRDFYPAAYYFSTVLWSGQFGRGHTRILESISRIPVSRVLFFPIALSIAIAVILAISTSQKRQTSAASLWSVIVNGYVLMTLQILFLLSFQSVFGYVYDELALLIGMFMAGIAAGSWLGIRHAGRTERRSLLRVAAVSQISLAASAPLLLGITNLLAQNLQPGASFSFARALYPIFAVLFAMPGGYLFPIASRIFLKRDGETNLASLYALDLAGGCAGALVLAGFVIPLFGFWAVAWLAFSLSLAPAALVLVASLKQPAI